MKLIYDRFDVQLNLSETLPYHIILENPVVMRQFVADLFEQTSVSEGRFLLSQNGKELHIDKAVELVYNPFDLVLNQKKILNRVYKELEGIAMRADFCQETMELQTKLRQYMQKLLNESDYPLDYNFDFAISKLFASLEIFFAEETSLLPKICQYMELCSKMLGKEIFVFCNLSTIFSQDDLAELYQEAAYRKIYLIMVESRLPKSVPQEKLLVIDEDLCIVQWHD